MPIKITVREIDEVLKEVGHPSTFYYSHAHDVERILKEKGLIEPLSSYRRSEEALPLGEEAFAIFSAPGE